MRLIAVPLARARHGAQPVCTYLAQRLTPPASTLPPSSSSSSNNASESGSASATAATETKQPALSTRILTKASQFWTALGRDGEGGKPTAILDWKRRTYNAGEKLMDRIEYEEWALKAVDPALGPRLEAAKAKAKAKQTLEKAKGSTEADWKNDAEQASIHLHYPANVVSPSTLIHNLRALTSSRSPHHRSRMVWCIIGMPFTIPFMLIPVVPNLPFFYLVWRAYSHWKAHSSSKYLSQLLSENRILPIPNKDLATVFEAPPLPAPDSTSGASTKVSSSSGSGKEGPSPTLLLSLDGIKLLAEKLEIDAQATNELIRARQQTIASIKRGQWDKIERAADGVKDNDKDAAGEDAGRKSEQGAGR